MQPPFPPRVLSTVRRRLLGWFDRNRRPLPWRQTRDPYLVWLSEMMLQQTQVATVIPYFRRFVHRFPTVRALAEAELEDILELWAGLGYYTRARNLHAAARMVVAQFGGRFPPTVEGLRRLPGVGPYSAGAIASIAFGVRAPLVDGNVARVLARLTDLPLDITKGKGKKAIWESAENLLPGTRCGDFNQALMELGALVCTPGESPRCPECPLASICRARRRGTVARLPIKARPAQPKAQTHVVAAIRRSDRWLIVKRPARGLWAGLWELPTCIATQRTTRRAAVRLSTRWWGGRVQVGPEAFCDLTHRLSHLTIRFIGYVCHATGPRTQTRGAASRKWVPLDRIASAPLSAVMHRIVDHLRERMATAPVDRSTRKRTARSDRRG